MNTDSLPFAVFVLITTFTPGPGNIASSGMGMIYGYRRTFSFLSGITAGYLVIMLLCAYMSKTLMDILPIIEPILRVSGSCYILWLAWATARSSWIISSETASPMAFKHGFWLQALNPKAIIFGLTIYTTFLSGIADHPLILTCSGFLLASVTFCSVSLWTFGGVRIQGYLHSGHIRRWVNSILVLLLVYCAVSLSGLFSPQFQP